MIEFNGPHELGKAIYFIKVIEKEIGRDALCEDDWDTICGMGEDNLNQSDLGWLYEKLFGEEL